MNTSPPEPRSTDPGPSDSQKPDLRQPGSRKRFVVVPHVRILMGAALAVWLASIIGAWVWAGRRAAPELEQVRATNAKVEARADGQQALVRQLRQRIATLGRSDQISREANRELQETLAQRDEEIAGLRADVAFYERLVGATGQRRGLSVHDVDLAQEADGTWRYTVTLTQNLNRGAISKGALTLQVEGMQAGKLATLAWGDLLQDAKAAPQPFAFRYFQQLEGSLLLPAGFTPRRLTVRLQADGVGGVERAFGWDEARQDKGGTQDVRRG